LGALSFKRPKEINRSSRFRGRAVSIEPTLRTSVTEMGDKNQNPEQIARDQIDKRLAEAGWVVQDKNAINFNAGQGIAVREYQTDVGPADYACSWTRKLSASLRPSPRTGDTRSQP
jgi:hypothetical protein